MGLNCSQKRMHWVSCARSSWWWLQSMISSPGIIATSIYEWNACEFTFLYSPYLLALTHEGNPWLSDDGGHLVAVVNWPGLLAILAFSHLYYLLSWLLVRSPKRVTPPGEVMKSTSWNEERGQWVCPEHRLSPLEGSLDLETEGTPGWLQMGEENLERVRGPRLGMSLAMRDLKELHSWAKRILGNI